MLSSLTRRLCANVLLKLLVKLLSVLKGTLKVEVPLASGVSGVVTRDAKGSGQGMITITDGNNLEMPAEVKFPQVTKKLIVCSPLTFQESNRLFCSWKRYMLLSE